MVHLHRIPTSFHKSHMNITQESCTGNAQISPSLARSFLHLPIFLVLKKHSESNLQPLFFMLQLLTPPQKWMGALWLNVKNCATLLALKTELASGTPIVICSSNATVDAAKLGSCAWTIYAKQYLWQGEVHAP